MILHFPQLFLHISSKYRCFYSQVYFQVISTFTDGRYFLFPGLCPGYFHISTQHICFYFQVTTQTQKFTILAIFLKFSCKYYSEKPILIPSHQKNPKSFEAFGTAFLWHWWQKFPKLRPARLRLLFCSFNHLCHNSVFLLIL